MQKWLNSVRNAQRGIILLLKTERNTKIELAIGIISVLLGVWLKISAIEWCIILLCIGGVMSAEAINTAIEKLSDYNATEWNSRIRDIKDMAAGAVLIMAIVSVIAGFIIFGPKIFSRIY